MKNTFYLFLISFAITFYSNAQLNDYKYIIIPKRLKEFKSENQYQTSTYLKYLFTQNNFNAIYDDVLPEDLKNGGCLGLKADLETNSSLFKTIVRIVVKDCNGAVVFSSMEGTSKEKEYKPAYIEAIKQAFISYQELNYKYVPKEKMENKTVTLNFKNDVKKLPADSGNKEMTKKTEDVVIGKEPTMKSPNPEGKESATAMKVIENKKLIILTEHTELLYAQPIENGFQLIDSVPKIQYKLVKTSVENVFLATHEDKNGVVLNKNGRWFFEYDEGGEKKFKELNIKF